MFASRQKYKDEGNDLMQGLVNLIMNSFYGVQIGKDINESYNCKFQNWMETDYDDEVLDTWKFQYGNYFVKMKEDDGLDGNNNNKTSLPSHLGAFILSKCKRIMNKIIREINGFYNNSIYYGNTKSLYKEKKYWDVLDTAGLVGSNPFQGKNNLTSLFFGLFELPRKLCFNIRWIWSFSTTYDF